MDENNNQSGTSENSLSKFQDHLIDGEKVEEVYRYSRKSFLLWYIIAGFFILSIIVPVIVIIVVEIKVRTTYFFVTNRRVCKLFDFISRNFVDTNYSDIKNVYYKQGILERILGIGRVYLSTAGTGGFEVKIGPISKYMDLYQLITSKRLG